MKKILSVLLASLTLFIGVQAHAFWVGGVYNETTAGYVNGIMGLDWSSSGSGLAIGLGPAGTPPVVGQAFDFYYQAKLVGVTDSVGGSVDFPGLNTAFEYTAVAKITERIIGVTELIPDSGLFSAVFQSTGGTFNIYYDSIANSSVPNGTGFNNGTVAVSGNLIPGDITVFTNTAVGAGIGSTILRGLVNYTDNAYFDPSIYIMDFRFEGTVNQPPLDSTTARFFDGNDGYAIHVVDTTTEQLFKVDGSSKFSTIPEPSTILLLGFGLLGIAGISRKRAKK